MRFLKHIIKEEVAGSIWLFHPTSFYKSLSIEESIDWEKAVVNVNRDDGRQFDATFDVGALHYVFMAIYIGNDIWDIQYDLLGREYEDGERAFDRLKSGKIHNGVLAAAVRCIRTFIEKRHPEKITFSTSDMRLMQLYSNMVAEFEHRLGMKCIRYIEGKDDGKPSMRWLYKVVK